MKTTMDRAGRLVVPKCLREQFHFDEGATIEISAEADGLYLRLPQATGRLIEKDGVLVQQADTAVPLYDTTALHAARAVERALSA